MRVLFLDQFSQMGGAQFVLRDLLAETQRRGWHPEIMLPGPGPLTRFCAQAAIPVRELPSMSYSNGRKSFADGVRYAFDMVVAARRVREAIRLLQPDLVYVNGPRLLPVVRRTPVPVVFHSHSLLDKRYARTIARWSLGRGDRRVIASSHHVAKPLEAMQPRIIYNGVADQGFVPRPRDTRRFHIALIGRVAPEKGQMDFVLAARKLAGLRKDVRFSIIGAPLFSRDGYEKEVRTAAAGLPVGFHGWTEDVAAALHEVDAIAVPSSGVEATPRIIVEALSAGTPVVAWQAGGIPELLRDRETGILVSPASPAALADAFAELLDNPDLMATLSYEGRREWESRFRADQRLSEICDVLLSIHGSQSHQRNALRESEENALR